VDLASNTLGAGLGGVLAQRLRVVLDPPPNRRRSMAVIWAIALSAAAVLPDLLLERSIAEAEVYVGWTSSLRSLETFTARVMSVRLDALPPPTSNGD